MNCAVHPDVPAAAYCRTCGRPLCEPCKRDVRGVIYCEDCLAARVQGTLPVAPTPGSVPPGTPVPVVVTSGPNPGLAGVLSALFPFGIGQVYCGLYAKGLAYLLIFVGLIWGVSTGGDRAAPAFGLAIAFFYFYQIIDAVRSARALQVGQAPPDPLGVQRILGGRKMEVSKIPVGAVVLIVIGLLMLLYNVGDFHWLHNLWPLGLVALGVWIISRRWSVQACECPRCRCTGLTWPAILITVGVLWLLDDLTRLYFDRTWPLLLVVIGATIIAERSAPTTGHVEPGPPLVQVGGSTEGRETKQEVNR
jgi:hypothetical protein